MSLTSWWLTYPVGGYLPLQDPPTADLLKAHKLLGYIKNVMSTAINVQVMLLVVVSLFGCCEAAPASHSLVVGLQEDRLLERDCALWRLHGDATVLITLAHIFNYFAPLMVRRLLLHGSEKLSER